VKSWIKLVPHYPAEWNPRFSRLVFRSHSTLRLVYKTGPFGSVGIGLKQNREMIMWTNWAARYVTDAVKQTRLMTGQRQHSVHSENTNWSRFGISGRGSSEKMGRWALVEGGVSAGCLTLSSFGSLGVLPRKFFWKCSCKSVQVGAFWGHQVIKSWTENRCFSVPRNLPSVPYRFRGPCSE